MGSKKSTRGTVQSDANKSTVTLLMMVPVPVDVQTNSQPNNGCRVRFTDQGDMQKKKQCLVKMIDSLHVDCNT